MKVVQISGNANRLYAAGRWGAWVFFLLALLVLANTHTAEAAPNSLCFVDANATGGNTGGSWQDAYTDLQSALGPASPCTEVWVAAGVYKPTSGTDRTATFALKNNVAVYGGFTGNETELGQRDWQTHITVLSGDIDQNDLTDPTGVVTNTANIIGANAYQVVTSSGVTETAVLDGFYLTAGQAQGTSPFNLGGGMYNDIASPTLANLVFSANLANHSGGGLYNTGGSPSLTQVTFARNRAAYGGGMYNTGGSPLLLQVRFEANYAVFGGGGLYNTGGSPSLTQVTFASNRVHNWQSGGGMYNCYGSPTLLNVAFLDNLVEGGGYGGGMANFYNGSPALTNVLFSGNRAYYGGGMYNEFISSTLTNVTFSGNTAADGGGMSNWYDSSATLTNVTFSGNSASWGGGMSNWYSNSTTLTNVTFSGNTASHLGGGMFNDETSSSLTNVTFSANTATDHGGGMYNNNSSPSLTNCILWGNTAGGSPSQIEGAATITYSDIQGGWTGGGNIDADPLFLGAPDNLRLGDGSPAIDTGTNSGCPATDLDGLLRPFDGDYDGTAICDMGAYEAQYWMVYYAAPAAQGNGDCLAWADACTLQTALSLASNGDQVWVQAGVHFPTSGTDRTATFALKNNVAVYGGFSGTETELNQRNWNAYITTLSGDTGVTGVMADNTYHVVTGIDITNAAILDGFTITGGNADGSYPNNCGGGMYNTSSSPSLTNITFSDNTVSSDGGGMYNWNSSPRLTNVAFSGNTASIRGGGMFNYDSSNPSLTDTTFSGNNADQGGGMYNYTSSPSLIDATFSGNTASGSCGGMANAYSSNPSLTNATFSGNTAINFGGGMCNSESSNSSLTNVTFNSNSASQGGGMFNYLTSDPSLINVILWGNSEGNIFNYLNSNPTVTYSDIQGCGGSSAWVIACGTDGGGNLDLDPLFVDAGSGNLRLQSLSPAVDASDNTAVPITVTQDLDGKPRFADIESVPDTGVGTAPIVDMGAYEVQMPELSGAQNAPASVNEMEVFTYTLVIENNGLGSAANVTLTDTLPTGLAFVGPVTLTPPQAGAVLGAPPSIASSIVITNGWAITLSIPVQALDGPMSIPANLVLVGAAEFNGTLPITSSVVNVANIAPTVEAGADQNAPEGAPLAFSGSFTDPGLLDTHTFEWDFGDDTSPITGAITLTRAYADNGIYTVTLTVVDDDGGTNTDTLLVTVANMAPTLSPIADQEIVAGTALTITAIYSDTGIIDTHTALVDFGDGFTQTIPLAAGLSTFDFSHTFDAIGVYTVTVTLTDDDGGQDMLIFQVTVGPSGYKIFLPTINNKQ